MGDDKALALKKLRDSITAARFPLPDAPDWAIENRCKLDESIAHAAAHGSADDREPLNPFVTGIIPTYAMNLTHEEIVANVSGLVCAYKAPIVECLRMLVSRYPSRANTCLCPAGWPTPSHDVAGRNPAARPRHVHWLGI